MGDDKNVLLTVIHKDEEEHDAFVVDMEAIWKRLKRLFALWLCLAVSIGSLSGAASLFSQNFLLEQKAKALITFGGGQSYDINKVKSPSVMEDALNTMGIDIEELSDFQKAVTIQSVIPSQAYERMSMYYDMLSKSAEPLEVVEALLNIDYGISRYIVAFDYKEAHISRNDGIAFLNTLLRTYQDYCAFNYNYNVSLRNPLSTIDYHDYDYAEAVNIFSNTLSNISGYLSDLNSGSGASFRSTQTGFTFQDLSRVVSLLRNVDLDRVSSYIIIHSISRYDAETEISYYNWLIEDLTRRRAVQRTRLASLSDSIDTYDKDSLVIIASQDGGSVVSGSGDLNANYDAMINEKLSTQATIASCTRSISYYESVIEGFQNSGASSNPADVERVDEYLRILNESVNQLIRNVSLTANEYYEKIAFANEIRVLVPATAEKIPLISSLALKIVIVVEVLLFMLYLAYAFVLGIRDSNVSRKEESEETETARNHTEVSLS